jgi:peroxiredoxin
MVLAAGGCSQQPAPDTGAGGPVAPIPSPSESSATTDAGPLAPPELNPPARPIEADETESPAASGQQDKPADGKQASQVGPAAAKQKPSPPKAASSAAKKPKSKPPARPDAAMLGEPATPLYEPLVVMSEAHAATCLVKVGDPLPELPLRDLEGGRQTISQFYGPKLTLVVFWTADKPFANEQFVRLEREVNQPFHDRGLSVVAVNVGDPADQVRGLGQQCEATFPSLLDDNGTALALVATGTLPRSYLLDSKGKILWLEIEYSQGARRELRNAIEYYSRNAS